MLSLSLPHHRRHRHIVVATTTSLLPLPMSATASTTMTVAITPCVNPFERGTAPVSSTIRVLTILCQHTFLSVPKSLAVASYIFGTLVYLLAHCNNKLFNLYAALQIWCKLWYSSG